MIVLRSALFNVLFFGFTAVVAIGCLPLLLMPSPAAVFRLSEFWTGSTIWLLARICGLTYEVRGTTPGKDTPCIVAVKHQSAWDTLVMPILLPRPAYVLKKELLRIPVFGWYLRKSGQIAIDRSGGAGAMRRMMARTRDALALGRPVLIFPEGTRAAPGTTGTYHPGVAALYRQVGVPVVPVALNSGLFWSRRAFRKQPGCIVVEFLSPISPGMQPRDFLAELETRIEGATRRLEAESTGKPTGPAGVS